MKFLYIFMAVASIGLSIAYFSEGTTFNTIIGGIWLFGGIVWTKTAINVFKFN